MKQALLAIVVMCSISICNAQTQQLADKTTKTATTTSKKLKLPLEDNKIVYRGTINLSDDYKKGELFPVAERWYRHDLQTSDNKLVIDNSDEGHLNGTGTLGMRKDEQHDVNSKDIFFTIDMIVGDQGYTYSVYDIYSLQDTTKIYYSDIYAEELHPLPKPRWTADYRKSVLTQMNNKIQQMLANLKQTMNYK